VQTEANEAARTAVEEVVVLRDRLTQAEARLSAAEGRLTALNTLVEALGRRP